MAQGFADDDEKNGQRARHGSPDADRHLDHDPNHDDSHRWPTEAPSVAVARVVLNVDEAITLKRTAAAAGLTAHHHAVPSLPRGLPLRPTRMELAVVIALAETYGAALYKETRFLPVIDCIANDGAVALVQRVMYGARAETDFDVTARTAENTRLAEVLRDARVAFEFLCATWPDVFLAETHALLADLGVHVRPPDADRMPQMGGADDADSDADTDAGPGDDDDDDADEPDEDAEGGYG
ncbi:MULTISPECIES: hypothetical protein [Caballeronia]|uniref:Uncharacterized protein n=1 Tax=Caballeronia zhejiangensis TaxID=871203 RepID=A0A656QGB3_9BURK|nr:MULTISPECIES: hypothetical protein [Caballeronia]EKS72030.1 hypothetical protein BURK_009366 [Burkholderia sp. SJ98]KDR26161.1 hypothetical protein BG60_23760 [Caballeronia zhejiangensis]